MLGTGRRYIFLSALLVAFIASSITERPGLKHASLCIDNEAAISTQCIDDIMGSTPFYLIHKDEVRYWGNLEQEFIRTKWRSWPITRDTYLQYSVSLRPIYVIRLIIWLLLALYLPYLLLPLITPKDRSVQLSGGIYLVILAILYHLIRWLNPHWLAGIDPNPLFGQALVAGGMIAIAIEAYQSIKTRKIHAEYTPLALLSLCIILAYPLYIGAQLPFDAQAGPVTLISYWLIRLLGTLTVVSIGAFLIKLLHSQISHQQKRTVLLVLVGVALGILSYLWFGLTAAVMIGISNIILLLLIDMTSEEQRLNFLWIVIWQLAISLFLTTNWMALSLEPPFTMSQIFNYLSLSFIGTFILTFVFLIINTLIDTTGGLTTLKIPLQFSLRHKIEIVVLGTLFFAFSSIGIMTYLIEHNAAADHTRSLLNVIKDSKTSLMRKETQLLNIDTMSLSQAKRPELSSKDRRLPFDLHTYFLNSDRDTLYGQSLARKINNDQVILINRSARGFYTNYENSILSKLLNLYVFLFITAIGLIYLLAGQITRPLAILGRKLLDIDLGKDNRKIEWHHQDELGHLISQYNNMIDQLDSSAEVLARNERDHAWKEMAKQVAHEIKNPLTPMKLTIQHLQMRAKNHSSDLDQHVNRASNTLIEQIDNLVRIANDFSQFGKMPQASNDKIILNEVITSVHDLFRKREDMDIQCFVPIDNLYVFADKDHLIRIFNNIIKNAIQAIPLNRKGRIVIRLNKDHHNAIVSITDNGIGIPDDQKSKVFRPNFTTKSSGTGLGLAMCNKMIHSMNGNISFETEVEKGSVFFVSIPLMRIDENFLPETDEKIETLT